jgi:hypothetical protein
MTSIDRAPTATAEDAVRATDRGPRLSTLFTLGFALGGLALGIRRLHDNSFMWHMRTGRFILEQGIPRRDPFSYTASGVEWVAQSWLAELSYGLADRVAGPFGIRVLGAAIGLLVGFLLFFIARYGTGENLRAGALAALTMATLLNVWTERPLMFGILAMLVLVIIVEAPTTWIARHPLITLPVLMWLWANTHGTFAIGFGYLGLHLIGRALEGHAPTRGRELDLAKGSVVAFVATFINPYGIDLVLFPLRLMGRGGQVLNDVAEWQSPNFREVSGMVFAAFLVCTFVLVARKRPGTRDVLVTVVFVLLGLYAIRNVGLTAIAILPILSRLARPELPGPNPRRSLHRAMAAGLGCVAVLLLVNAAAEPDWELREYPVVAYGALADQGLEGRRLFTTDAWGGYVIARAGPDQKVFFDDRYDMYPIAVNHDYTTVARLEPGWYEVLDRYGVEVVMMPRAHKLVYALEGRPEWRRVHDDAVGALFVRRSLAP